MIVVNSRAGQRSNRLVTIAHAMATAIERGKTLRLTAFDAFKEDYLMKVQWGGKVVTGDSKFWEIARLAIAAFKRMGWKNPLEGRVVSDWTYRNRIALEMHADDIRAFFSPKDVSEAEKHLNGIKSDGVLVGVHVRRGDYRDFEGGKYYYEDEVYDRNKAAIEREFASKGKNVQFLMFPCRTAVEDQWMMSQCDYLMGPPSTFTMWASFMGKVPLGIIKCKTDTLTLADFRYEGLIA